MRNWIFYIVFCLFSYKAVSQSFNYDIHSEYNSTQANLLQYKNNLYFTSKRSHSGSSQILDFYSYANTGSFRFKKSFPFSEGHDVAKLFISNDSSIAIIGQFYQCDNGGPTTFLMKLDTNGNVVFSKSFTVSPMANNQIIDGCQMSNNNYYFISRNRIFNIDALGNYISMKSGLDTLASITPYNGNNFIVNGKSTNFWGPEIRNFILTPTLAIVNNYTTTNYYTKIIHNKGSYFGLAKQGYIEKLDTTFQAISNTKILQNYSLGYSVSDFKIILDTIYAVGYKSDNTSNMLIRTDTNLVLISNNQNSSPKHLPKSIASINTSAYILSNNTDIIPHISLIAVPKTNMYSFNNDIKLCRVLIDSSYATNTYTTWAEFVNIRFKATIKNMSSTQLNSFYLTADIGSFSGYCYKRLFHKNYNGLSIAPGDSITVQTDPIIGLLTSYYFPNYVTLSNICFVATAPNGKNDLNALDNTSCPGNVINPVGISQKYNTVIAPNIYPNPVNDKLTIVNNGNIDFIKAQIINNVGQVVEEFNLIFNSKQSEIILKNLPNGVYSLNLKTIENVVINKRFIVSH